MKKWNSFSQSVQNCHSFYKDGIAPHDTGERVKGGDISFDVCMGSKLDSLADTTGPSFSSDLNRTVPMVWPPISAM